MSKSINGMTSAMFWSRDPEVVWLLKYFEESKSWISDERMWDRNKKHTLWRRKYFKSYLSIIIRTWQRGIWPQLGWICWNRPPPSDITFLMNENPPTNQMHPCGATYITEIPEPALGCFRFANLVSGESLNKIWLGKTFLQISIKLQRTVSCC